MECLILDLKLFGNNVDLICLLNFMPIAMEDYFLILLSKDPISSL